MLYPIELGVRVLVSKVLRGGIGGEMAARPLRKARRNEMLSPDRVWIITAAGYFSITRFLAGIG